MPSCSRRLAVAAALGCATAAIFAADRAVLERGAYLVAVGGCGDCHTPGHLTGSPDRKRFLGGADVGFAIPGMGVFLGPNLTPDKETGLGSWTTQQIVTAFTTGRRPDGRQLAPAMPYANLARLTAADARAMALYLQSLPPVSNKVPGPFGPDDKPTTPVSTVVPPAVYATLPKPPGK